MGFEISASHLIFFIGTVAVAVVVVGAMSLATQSFTGSLEEKGDRTGAQLASDVTILNDPTNMVYNRTTRALVLYVKNTGSRTLEPSLTEVYVNGTYLAVTDTTLMGGATIWEPSKTLQVTVSVYLPVGDHALKIVAQNAADDQLDFRIS